MLIGKVIGSVVSTRKSEKLIGNKFMIVELAEKMGDKLWWMENTLQPISKDRLANYLTDVLDTTVERTRMF